MAFRLFDLFSCYSLVKIMTQLAWSTFAVRSVPVRFVLMVAAFNAAFSGIRWLFGYYDVLLLALFAGAVSVVLPLMILDGRNSQGRRWALLGRYLITHWRMVLKSTLVFCGLYLGFFHSSTPEIEFVAGVMSAISACGIILLFPMILLGLFMIVFSRSRQDGIDCLRSAVRFCVMYCLVLFAIGNFGDDLYLHVQSNPGEAAMFLVALPIFLVMCYFSRLIPSNHGVTGLVGTAAAMHSIPKMSSRDIQHTAVHEASHALVYAALGSLPNYFKVVVNSNRDSDVCGYVTNIYSGHQLQEDRFLEWYMLVLLAGRVGEIHFHGDGKASAGAGSDYQKWVRTAQDYLTGTFSDLYYDGPKTILEQQSNNAKLEALKATQIGLLTAFFEMNTCVLRDMVSDLEANGSLNHETATPYLQRVKLPEGFPLPFGPFDEFSCDWPHGGNADFGG